MKDKEIIQKAQQERRAALTYAKSRMEDMFTFFGEKIGGETVTFGEPVKIDPEQLKALERELDKRQKDLKAKTATAYLARVSNEVAVLKHKLDFAESIFNTYKLDNPSKLRVIEMLDLAITVRDVKMVYVTVVAMLELRKEDNEEV